MKKIKVLFVLGSMDIGGVQSGIMNFIKLVPEYVQIDVLVHTDKIGFHEEEFKKYGQIFHIPIITINKKYKLLNFIFKIINNYIFKRKFSYFLKNHSYDVVHSKSLGLTASCLEAAYLNNVPIRIAQCHMDQPKKLSFLYKSYYKWCAKRIEKNATYKLGVCESAVDLMFHKFGGTVIKNPTISLKRLNPTNYKYKEHNSINLIQIGTYSHRKNQCFSVEILKEILELGYDAYLTFIGYTFDDLNYFHELKNIVDQYNLNDNIKFLPKDTDVTKLLSENDYMLLPSIREGIPNVALEAQAMGLVCFLSDTITKQTNCGLCEFLSLYNGAKFWAEKIIEYRQNNGSLKKFVDMSMWDNETVIKEYLKIWGVNNAF